MEPIEYKLTITDKIKDVLFVIVLILFTLFVTIKLAYGIFIDISYSPKYGGATLGYAFFGIGSFFSALNFYLSFIRPWLYHRKHNNMENYRYVSGIPLIGSMLLFLASLWLNQTLVLASGIFFFYIIDTNGIHVASYVIMREIYNEKLSS